jgi:hypothetical protein
MIGLVRTAGLSGEARDIDNWRESLGLASLFVEGALVGAVLVARVGPTAPVRAPRLAMQVMLQRSPP